MANEIYLTPTFENENTATAIVNDFLTIANRILSGNIPQNAIINILKSEICEHEQYKNIFPASKLAAPLKFDYARFACMTGFLCHMITKAANDSSLSGEQCKQLAFFVFYLCDRTQGRSHPTTVVIGEKPNPKEGEKPNPKEPEEIFPCPYEDLLSVQNPPPWHSALCKYLKFCDPEARKEDETGLKSLRIWAPVGLITGTIGALCIGAPMLILGIAFGATLPATLATAGIGLFIIGVACAVTAVSAFLIGALFNRSPPIMQSDVHPYEHEPVVTNSKVQTMRQIYRDYLQPNSLQQNIEVHSPVLQPQGAPESNLQPATDYDYYLKLNP